MPGALFSRLNRSFGIPPAIPERRTGALEKIETAALHYPLRLESLAEIAPKMADKTVIVIGAGFAGLTAGWWLATHGFDVTVLEARNRVGGHVHTKRDISRFWNAEESSSAEIMPIGFGSPAILVWA